MTLAVVFSAGEVVTGSRLEPASAAAIALAGWWYWSAARRLGDRGRQWPWRRTGPFLGGLLVLVVATQSGIGTVDTTSFTAHVIQHLLLGMVAPIFLALGAPVTLALQSSNRRLRARLIRVLHSAPVSVLTHPVTAWALFGGPMFALYFTGLYAATLRSVGLHDLVHLVFVMGGCLFFWPVVGLDPTPHRLGYGARMLYVMLALPFHTIIGVALTTQTKLIAPGITLGDQQTGAGVLWTAGELLGIIAVIIVGVQWMAAEEREAVRQDRRLDARGQTVGRPDGDGDGHGLGLGIGPVPVPVVIDLAEIEAARDRLKAILRPTPARRSESLSALAGRTIILKPEYLQRTGSFKVRGAYNLISQLPQGSEVVAASAGNHAQGVAFAAAAGGIKATIFMAEGASLPKVEATRSYGAEVRLEGKVVDDCFALARQYAADTGAMLVPPFDHPLVIAGQGTIGLELIEEAPEAEVVVVPVGGGGLVSGVAAAMALRNTGVRVVGVEPAGAAAVTASMAAGRTVILDHIRTMADGIAVKSTSDLVLDHVRAYVDEVVTVDEEEIARAVLLLLERAKAVVEPAGAVGLAAILAGKIRGDGAAVALLSGGNVDPLLLIKMVDHGLSAAGRYLVFRAVLDDRPGALAGLTATLASMSLNVLQVAHHRSGLELGIQEVDVQMTVETRGPEHRGSVLDSLKAAGYRVEPVG